MLRKLDRKSFKIIKNIIEVKINYEFLKQILIIWYVHNFVFWFYLQVAILSIFILILKKYKTNIRLILF
jgi:hypothetical protein